MAAFRSPPERLLRPAVQAVAARRRMNFPPSRMYRAAVCRELGKPLVIENLPATSKLKSTQVKI